MAKRSLFAGSTSIATLVRIFDVNGSPITGLVYNSTGLLAKYDVPGSATATITLATQTVSGAFSSGGFVEIDATAFPGLYRLDVPNAALANGPEVVISLYGYVGMAACMLEFDLWAVNPQDATAFGVSRIDALISSRMATFSLPTNFSSLSIDASGRVDLVKVLGATINALISGRLDISLGAYQTGLTPLQPATAGRTLVVDAAGLADANAVKVGPTGSGTAQTARDIGATLGAAGAGLTALGDTRIAHLDADVSTRTKPADTQAAVTTVTNITNAPTAGDFTATMKTSLNAATPAVTVSDKTGFSLTSAYDPAKTAAQAGDSMALTSGERTTLTAVMWAALTSGLTTVNSIGKRISYYLTGDSYARLGAPAGASVSADVAAVKVDTAAIKLKTDNLPASPAAVGSAMTLTSAYDSAKTAAQTGDSMALTSGERTTLAGVMWAALTSGFSTVGSIGKRIVDYLTGDSYTRLGTPAGASVSADIAVIAGRVFRVKKNTALAGFQFPMTSAAGLGLTGLTVTAQRSLDGGALASCANAVSEISDGVYTINLAASDLNADTVFLRFSATGAIDTTVTLVTQP